MTYQFDPREAMRQVCEAAAGQMTFPRPSSGRLVCEAIEALKLENACPADVATAEQLSVLLYRLEIATWSRDPDEPQKIRAAIAAHIEKIKENTTDEFYT